MKRMNFYRAVLTVISVAVISCSDNQPIEPDFSHLGRNGFVSSDSVPVVLNCPTYPHSGDFHIDMNHATSERSSNPERSTASVWGHILKGGVMVNAGPLTISSARIFPEAIGPNSYIYYTEELLDLPASTVVNGQETVWRLEQNTIGVPPFDSRFFSSPPFRAKVKGISSSGGSNYFVSQKGAIELSWETSAINEPVHIYVEYNKIFPPNNRKEDLPSGKIEFIATVPDNGYYVVPPAILSELPVNATFSIVMSRQHCRVSTSRDSRSVMRYSTANFFHLRVELRE